MSRLILKTITCFAFLLSSSYLSTASDDNGFIRSTVNGRHIIVRIPNMDGARNKWNQTTENPPLSIRKAMQKARPALKSIVKPEDGWWVYSVTLRQAASDRWHYEIEYLGPSYGISAQKLTLIVLLDGSVPMPEIEKAPFEP